MFSKYALLCVLGRIEMIQTSHFRLTQRNEHTFTTKVCPNGILGIISIGWREEGEIKRERENYLKLLCDFRQIPFSILQMVNFHIPFSWILNKGFDELQFSCSGLSSVLCSNRYWAEKCWVSQAWWSILWILVVKWKVSPLDPLYQNVRQERLWDYRDSGMKRLPNKSTKSTWYAFNRNEFDSGSQ